jgi:hypothetical protein
MQNVWFCFAESGRVAENNKAARKPAVLEGFSLLGGLRLWRWGRLNCVKVEVEQRIALVALILVLLPEPDDLLQDLDVEALALGLGKDALGDQTIRISKGERYAMNENSNIVGSR